MSEITDLKAIGDRLRTQDNRCTAEPMFCVQKLVRDVGYALDFVYNRCWHDSRNEESIYDDDPDFNGPPKDTEGNKEEDEPPRKWEEFGYRDRWETVMTCFTEEGANDYLRLNGHNVARSAFKGRVRIYVESYYRCNEMIAIREWLMKQDSVTSA